MKQRIVKVFAGFLIALILLGAAGAIFHLRPPVIRASNIEAFNYKISSNAPITVTFSQLMNRDSVEKGFKISPQMSGKFSWTLNKMTFTPDEKMKIGETYAVTIPGDITNILGQPLGQEKTLIFIVMDAPKISLAVPNGDTSVDSKITVMFDRPMTELTTYDVVESRDFPAQITPEVKGKFKWIGTAAFQFVPEKRLDYSTEYTVKIPAGVASLDGGKMEQDYSFTFKTQRIALAGDQNYSGHISGKDPYVLYFNQPAKLESVLQHVEISQKNGGKIDLKADYSKRTDVTYDKDGKRQEKEVTDRKAVELRPLQGDFGYENGYNIVVTKEIAGMEGNLATETELKKEFFTLAFADFSLGGDGRAMNPNGDITFYFDNDVDVDEVSRNFSIEPEAKFSAKYGRKCDPKWEPKDSPDEECKKVEDTQSVVFTPKEKLKNLQQYKGHLSKNVKAKNGIVYLKNDLVWSFVTADTLKIAGTGTAQGATGSYKQLCLYTNNLIDVKDLEKQITVEPAGKMKVKVSSYLPYESSYRDNYSNEVQNCKPNKKLYALDVRFLLNPAAATKFTLKAAAKDTFGQQLSTDYNLKFTTEQMQDADTGLEILQRDFYAVVTPDQHAKPVIASYNLTDFNLEICRLSADKILEIETQYNKSEDINKRYQDYGWPAFLPSPDNCVEYKNIFKKIKPVYWEDQYVEVDLAAELGAKADKGYYYIKASSPHAYRTEQNYQYDAVSGEYKNIGFKKIPIEPDQVLDLTALHATSKKSKENVLFWVTDITGGKPVSGATIQLFTNKGEAISDVSTTDKNGIANRKLNDLPFSFAMVEKGGDKILLDTDSGDGISPWDYNLGYSELQRYTQGYVYTERPLYQPTHEVFFKGILRDDNDAFLSLPKAKEIDVEIADSRGSRVYKKKLVVGKQGTFSDSLKLDKAAPLGRYSISACLKRNEKGGYCENNEFYQNFFVEEYRKPEYNMEVSYSKEAYVDKEELNATLSARYFFGAPVSKGKVSWTLRAQNYYFDEYKDEWFSFTDKDTFRKCYFGCPYNDEYLTSKEDILNGDGKLEVKYKIDLAGKDEQGKPKPADSSKIYTLEATVSDANNQTVSGRKEIIAHRGQFYVGVKNEEYIVGAGQEMPVKVITVDHKGGPLEGISVDLELIKTDWKYVKKKHLDGTFYWDNELEEKSVKKTSVTTGDGGKAGYNFEIDEGGEYLVRATGRDSIGNSFSSSVDFYATTDKVVSWKQENNNRMELKLDKMSYEVGDTAKVLVKSPYSNVKALVTYERGNVFEYKVTDISSNAQVIEVPVTEKMLPNFYISILEIKGGNKEDPPDFKLGYANVVVNAKKKELKISIKPDKKRYQPRETVNLEISTTDREGNPVSADVSLSAVDASLLALKGNPKRDLVGVFYNNRYLGVLTADNLTGLLERVNLSDLKGSKGGAGKGADEFGKPRGEFEDTAFWRNSLSTNSGGKLLVSFTLPDNLTTWNIEAVGSTENSLFGDANETVTTEKAVMVRPLVPRFALFKDNLKVGAIVHNFTGSDAKFKIKLDAKNLEITDSKEKSVKIAAGSSEKVMWETLVPKVKNGTLAEVTISSEGNGAADSVIQQFPIYSYSTPETVALSAFTDDLSFTEKVFLPDSIDPELGEFKITTGATLATYISDSLNYLLTYPYGCTEQLISSLVPNVVLKNAVSLRALADKITLAEIRDEDGKVIKFDDLVSKTLQKLYEYQQPDGGFGYFKESRESYPYLTAYAVFGFDQLKKAGYSVDGNVKARAISYLQDYMRSNKDLKDPVTGKLNKKDAYWAANRAYMLFVMSEIGSGDIGLTNSLYGDKDLLSNAGKAYLAMTIDNLASDQTGKIKELVKQLENQSRIDARGTYIRNDTGSSFEMMTNTKATALVTQMLTRVDPAHPLLPKYVNWLIKARKDGKWDTTQDNAAALIALTEYLQKTKEADANYSAKIIMNEKLIGQYDVDGKTILDKQEIVRAISDLIIGGNGNEVVFTKNGTGRLYYDMALKYFLPIEKIAARSEGFNIERNYYKISDTKMEHPLKEAVAGETLRGKLTIIAPEDRHFVAAENFLPAGFELVNFEFETSKRSLAALPTSGEGEYGKGGALPIPCTDDYCPESDFGYSSGYYSGFSPWTHKEVRADRLFLFADKLNKGVYEYDYYVQVASEGKFHNPPAVISEMYFPENFGRTTGEWMEVK